jgi:hypothetical protein
VDSEKSCIFAEKYKRIGEVMASTLQLNQQQQIQSFWNLIQASDEDVQRGLLHLLNTKYASQKMHRQERSSFFGLKGILKSKGNTDTDKKLIDDYLKEKYD